MRKRSEENNASADNSDQSSSVADTIPSEVNMESLDQEKLLPTTTTTKTSTSSPLSQNEKIRADFLARVGAALFYGISSFMITVVNKHVLTVHKFPSFQILGLGQMTATILVLLFCKWFRIINFPGLTKETVRKIWPLPLLYIGNMLFGLGGTKELSLPMMTVLRRFSILMTMIGEFYILKVNPELKVQLSVYMMIVGAIIAACNDLAFSLKGYTFILLNDFCTAANGVVTKQKLEAKDLGKYGLLFYNALFMWVPTLLLTIYTGDIRAVSVFNGWSIDFIFEFLLSCVFGFVLMYATVLCTQKNSALTTTIVGCLKNVLVTYLGMVIGGDYVFNWPNFIGLNISVIGSLIYTKVTFTTKKKTPLPSAIKQPTLKIEK